MADVDKEKSAALQTLLKEHNNYYQMKNLIDNAPITKTDLFFRNQAKLMQNSILPSFERRKLTQQMYGQQNLADTLSKPRERSQREKFQTFDTSSKWNLTNKKPTDHFSNNGKGYFESYRKTFDAQNNFKTLDASS